MGHKSASHTFSNCLGCVLTHYPLSRWFIRLIWQSTIIVHFDPKTDILLPHLDLEMEPGEGLNGIPGWPVGVLEGITMSYKVKKSHIAHIQFAYGLFSQCPFFCKSGIFSDPPYGGKNNFVGSNEHNPWVSYIKLHLKMPGVYQLQISPPPTLAVLFTLVDSGIVVVVVWSRR